MKLKKIGLGLGLAASFSLIACGGDSAVDNEAPKENTAESFDKLPDCGKKLGNEIYTVEDKETSFICNSNKKDWIEIIASSKKLPECTDEKEETIYYVDADEEFVICTESGDWETLTSESTKESSENSSSSKVEEDSDKSSSSKKTIDDEEDNEDDNDEETKTTKSNYIVRFDTIAGQVIKTDTLKLHQTIVIRDTTYVTVTVKKTNTEGEVVAEQQLMPAVNARVSNDLTCSNALFCGKRGDARVNTGFSDATDTYGWWYTYTDDHEGGNSKITWPHGLNEYKDFVPPSVLATAGIQGTVKMGNNYKYPYAGLGFNLKNESQSPVDITSWDGMCVVYYASHPMYLEIHAANEDDVTGYNNPKAILPSSLDYNNHNLIADIDWNYFVQEEGWGKEASLSSVLQKAGSISFKFTGEQETSYGFIIFAIGPKGTCSTINKEPASSASVYSSSSSPKTNEPVDIFNGAGVFNSKTGSLSAFTVGNYYNAGKIGIIENDGSENVLEFYPTENCIENWWMQVKKDVSLEVGYSYQILLVGYDYGTTLSVPIGITDKATEKTIFTDKFVWNTDETVSPTISYASQEYKNCDKKISGSFYINGGFNSGEGFAVVSVKLIKTPISCD